MEPVESLAGTRPDTFQTRRLDFRFGWNFSTIISLSLSFSFSGSGCWKRRKRRGKLFVSSCGRRGFENWHPLQFAMSSVPIVSCKSNFSFHFCVFFGKITFLRENVANSIRKLRPSERPRFEKLRNLAHVRCKLAVAWLLRNCRGGWGWRFGRRGR